jgi:hypothetical protein
MAIIKNVIVAAAVVVVVVVAAAATVTFIMIMIIDVAVVVVIIDMAAIISVVTTITAVFTFSALTAGESPLPLSSCHFLVLIKSLAQLCLLRFSVLVSDSGLFLVWFGLVWFCFICYALDDTHTHTHLHTHNEST